MSNSLKIAQIGDVHFGAEDKSAVERAIALIKKEQPDLIVACGDLTQRGKRVEFRAASQFLESFDAPVLSVPGNHDVPLLNMYSRAKAPFDRYQRFLGQFDRAHYVSETVALGINSARGMQARRNWAEGSIDLEKLSADIERHRPQILVAHHPFVQPPGAKLKVRTRRGLRALDYVAGAGVKLILTGHVHEPSSFEHSGANGDKLVSISCGTLSSRLRQSPPSLNIVHFSSDRILAQVVTVTDQPMISQEMTFHV